MEKDIKKMEEEQLVLELECKKMDILEMKHTALRRTIETGTNGIKNLQGTANDSEVKNLRGELAKLCIIAITKLSPAVNALNL